MTKSPKTVNFSTQVIDFGAVNLQMYVNFLNEVDPDAVTFGEEDMMVIGYSRGKLIVQSTEDHAVGMSFILERKDLNSGCLWNLHVHDDFRRMGIANTLIKKTLEISKNRCFLFTYPGEKHLPKMYKQHGFTHIYPVPYWRSMFATVEDRRKASVANNDGILMSTFPMKTGV